MNTLPRPDQRRFDAHLSFFGNQTTVIGGASSLIPIIRIGDRLKLLCMPPQLILFLFRSEAWKLAVCEVVGGKRISNNTPVLLEHRGGQIASP